VLVLSRKSGQKLHIGADVVVTILEIRGNRVRIGIDGPPEVPIHRGEIFARIQTAPVVALIEHRLPETGCLLGAT
jgi:carbon storage regulator